MTKEKLFVILTRILIVLFSLAEIFTLAFYFLVKDDKTYSSKFHNFIDTLPRHMIIMAIFLIFFIGLYIFIKLFTTFDDKEEIESEENSSSDQNFKDLSNN